MGKDINSGATTSLRDIDPSQGMVVVEGSIFKISHRLIKERKLSHDSSF